MTDGAAGSAGGGRAAGGATFGALLREHRRAAGLTHEALAERAALSARAISDLERGVNRAPRPDTLRLLAEALGLAPGARAALAAAAQPGVAVRHNLPLQLTSFVGRERELAAVRRLLGPGGPPGGAGNPRLVTLTGTGGVGKTRLAQQVAAGLLEAYPEGVWYVELAPLARPALVPDTVATTLGIHEQPGRSVVEGLVAVLAPRTVLLVLDNCEHLAGACAALAERLLRACPSLRVLATSRRALGVAGETAWRVPSLAVPEPEARGPGAAGRPGTGPARAAQHAARVESEAVRLFAARASAARPDFVVSVQNAPAVADVCRRLDGIPLAIELAAARVGVLSAEQIGARLADRFRVLGGGRATAVPRHRTLRALVDWSYELLAEPERRLLGRLAVFAGGASLEAVEAVCAGPGLAEPEVLDTVARLVDQSLVIAEEAEEGAGAMRYRLLETIRAYGWERLRATGEEDDVRGRHLAWFRALAEHADTEFYGPAQMVWFRGLRLERDNVRAALAWSLAAGGPAAAARLEAGLALAGALWRFWGMWGLASEGRAWSAELLARCGPSARPAARAMALIALGLAAYWQRDLGVAGASWEEALDLCRGRDDRLTLAHALIANGMLAVGQGHIDRGITLLEEAQEVSRAIGFAWGLGISAAWLGQSAWLRGDQPHAIELVERSITLARDAGDRWYAASSLLVLGTMVLAREGTERATALFRAGLEIYREFDDAHWMAMSLEALGWAAHARGQPARAARLMGGVEAADETLGRRLWVYFQTDHDRIVAAARAALGDEAFAGAWTAGRGVPLDRLVEEELAAAQAPPAGAPPRAPARSPLDPLTRRERDVARLLARGLSNRQIAEALVIAEKTAGVHTQRVLRKLDLRSRHQVADRLAGA